jgi:hypothetical protein
MDRNRVEGNWRQTKGEVRNGGESSPTTSSKASAASLRQNPAALRIRKTAPVGISITDTVVRLGELTDPASMGSFLPRIF